MKIIFCLFLTFMLTGCALIVREDQNIKGVGISRQDAQQIVEKLQ